MSAHACRSRREGKTINGGPGSHCMSEMSASRPVRSDISNRRSGGELRVMGEKEMWGKSSQANN